ncbi:MAG: hypothetical protein ACTHJN_08900 [Ginsengibacter sp.]
MLEVLKSDSFKKSLELINVNYPNLKQEGVIRNAILDELNRIFKNENSSKKAFAEHPRLAGKRVDLSIVDREELKTPFLIEFKFQFSNDYHGLSRFKEVIEHDFQRSMGERQTDLFVLIVVSWDKESKREFDKKWDLSSNLDRFVGSDENWKNRITDTFHSFDDCQLDELDFVINRPYETNYKFFLLSRNCKKQ